MTQLLKIRLLDRHLAPEEQSRRDNLCSNNGTLVHPTLAQLVGAGPQTAGGFCTTAQTAQAQCDYFFQRLSRARPLDIQTLRPVFGNLKTGRVSDAATAVVATRNSECPKPSEVTHGSGP